MPNIYKFHLLRKSLEKKKRNEIQIDLSKSGKILNSAVCTTGLTLDMWINAQGSSVS